MDKYQQKSWKPNDIHRASSDGNENTPLFGTIRIEDEIFKNKKTIH